MYIYISNRWITDLYTGSGGSSSSQGFTWRRLLRIHVLPVSDMVDPPDASLSLSLSLSLSFSLSPSIESSSSDTSAFSTVLNSSMGSCLISSLILIGGFSEVDSSCCCRLRRLTFDLWAEIREWVEAMNLQMNTSVICFSFLRNQHFTK